MQVKDKFNFKQSALACVLALLLLMWVMPGIARAEAVNESAGNRLEIEKHDAKPDHLLTEQPSIFKPVAGSIYRIWHLTEVDDLKAQLKQLSSLSISELDQRYDAINSDPTDAQGLTVVDNLADGRYYAREVKVNKTKLEAVAGDVPFIVDLPYQGARVLRVYPKNTGNVPPQDVKCRVRLTKYGQPAQQVAREKLAGVKFELYRRNLDGADSKIPVKDGKYDASGSTVLTTDANGVIEVRDLQPGDYYFKEVETLTGYLLLPKPLEFSFTADQVVIELEATNYQTEVGGIKLRKIDDNGKGLLGAQFKLLQKNADGTYSTVLKDGVEYIATSDEEGNFSFVDLPLGTYYLAEIRTPQITGKQYSSLLNTVQVEITANSYNEGKLIEVVNHEVPPTPELPRKPGKPVIPQTGDLRIFIFFGIGLLLICTGCCLYWRTRKELSNER